MNLINKYYNLIAILLFIIVVFVFCKKYYKKCESKTEKILYIYLSSIIIFIMILYQCDRYNISSYFRIGENINSQNWLNILSSLGISILAEILAGLILIYVTHIQIIETRKDAREKEKEDRRINNMPLLVYKFLDNNTESSKINNLYKLETLEKGKQTEFTLSIKNIGMNAMRKCYIQIKGKDLKRVSICELDEQSSLNKNESKAITFFLNLDFGKHNYEIVVYYEDLLHNWYSQKIDFDFELFDERTMINYYTEEKFKVYDEEIIEKPNLDLNIDKYIF